MKPMVLAVFVTLVAPLHPPSERTSNIEQGLFVLSSRTSSALASREELFLAKKRGAGHVVLAKIPYTREEREGVDRLYVTGSRVVVLLATRTGRYAHLFATRRDGGYRFEQWPPGSNQTYLGSSRAVRLKNSIIGSVWISPTHSKALTGNYLYVCSPTGVRFGRLPGAEEGYEVRKGKDNLHFELVRWSPRTKAESVTSHTLPLRMENGEWRLGPNRGAGVESKRLPTVWDGTDYLQERS